MVGELHLIRNTNDLSRKQHIFSWFNQITQIVFTLLSRLIKSMVIEKGANMNKVYNLKADKKMLSGNLKGLVLDWSVNYPSIDSALDAAASLLHQRKDLNGDKCQFQNLILIDRQNNEPIILTLEQ